MIGGEKICIQKLIHSAKKVRGNQYGKFGVIAEIVANIGFPIVLSIFFLTELDKAIEKLQESINEILRIIKKEKD
jgi:predicted PurR-regulated permease PerM